MKIAVLGAGNMGLSFSKSFLKYELIKPQNLHLITRNENKKIKIKESFPDSEISTFDEIKMALHGLEGRRISWPWG